MKHIHNLDKFSEVCPEAEDVENQEPGEKQAVKHVWLEYEAQIVQCVLPLLTFAGYEVYLCMGHSHSGSCA